MIVDSKVLTLRLTLFFTTDNYLYPLDVYEDKFDDLFEKSKEFPYRNFKFYIQEPRSMEIWNKIQDKFIKVIKDPLKLDLSSVPKLVMFRVLELSASTLTHLRLSFDSDQDSIQDLPNEFSNLVSLKLYDHAIPRSMKAPKLKELIYSGSFRYLASNQENFAEFLCKFENLKKLETATVPIIDKNLIKFKFEELFFHTHRFELETMKTFLLSQQKSLRIIYLNDEDLEDCREFINFLIPHTKLEELSVQSNYDENSHPQEIEDVNYSVKKLHLDLRPVRGWPASNYYIPILKKFCAVEKLRLPALKRMEAVFEEVDLSNLKKLSLGFCDDNSFDRFNFGQVKLEKIEKISIWYIRHRSDITNLVKVTSFCPNLKILNIGTIDSFPQKNSLFKKSHFETLFKFSPNLEDFVINSCPYLLNSFMFYIMTVKSNLIRLKVSVSCTDRIIEMQKKLGNSKFLCDIHDSHITGMKPVKWNENEKNSW